MGPIRGCNSYGRLMRKSGYDSMTFILELTVADTAPHSVSAIILHCVEGGVQYAPYLEGSWVEKLWHVCCCYSHDVSGEQALKREVVIETKPSRDGLVE